MFTSLWSRLRTRFLTYLTFFSSLLTITRPFFPKLWKCSKITALFKSGDRTNVSNYRPISILPTLSKILEKAVHSQLYQYLVTNNLLTRKQFGFRKGFSTCFKYLGILISSDFTRTNHVEYMAGKINQRLGLLRRIKHLLPFMARILFYKSLVMPLFEYADLVWGDKHNVTLMSSLQVLQNKAAKIILDRLLYSSASHALVTLKWIPLEKRRFQRRCVHVYKCLNGFINHELTLVTKQHQHNYNTTHKVNLRLPALERIGENKELPITLLMILILSAR